MKQLFSVFGLLGVLATVIPAAAAPSPGIAYDSVTKFVMGGDAQSTQPGTFETDFQTASQPVQQPKGGGLFGGLSASLAQGMAGMSMFKNGLAERHYIAPPRERTDNPAAQTATILDCQARTLATLNLKNKTYTLVSIDAPQKPVAGGSRGGAPQGVPTDDGTRIAINVTNQALGKRQIGPDLADGYKSNMTMTVTKADGTSSTSQIVKTDYLIDFADYTLTCKSLAQNVPGPGSAAMAQYAMAQRAMATKNSRFSMTSSGPAIPANRFPLFTMTTMGGSGAAAGSGGPSGAPAGGSFASIMERGHERAITSDDPIFSIPADFTKTN
jgi:hypothetical protein